MQVKLLNKARYPLVFNLHDPLELLRIFAQNFIAQCPSPSAIKRCKNIAEKFRSVPRVQQRHRRQTDDRRTTDGRLMPQGEGNVVTFA